MYWSKDARIGSKPTFSNWQKLGRNKKYKKQPNPKPNSSRKTTPGLAIDKDKPSSYDQTTPQVMSHLLQHVLIYISKSQPIHPVVDIM